MVNIKIRNLYKQVICPDKSSLTILSVPSLNIMAGEQLLLTGASGSGKTTLLHLLAGLVTPTGGDIIYDNLHFSQLLAKEKDSWRAANIGYIFQKLNLLPSLTILENVILGGFFSADGGAISKEMKKTALRLLITVGMGKKIDLKPHCLSLGEQQRVAVVRALLKKPAIMLADEPTASVDQDNTAIILQLLQELCKENKTTLVLSTHDSRIIAKFSSRYDLVTGGRQN